MRSCVSPVDCPCGASGEEGREPHGKTTIIEGTRNRFPGDILHLDGGTLDWDEIPLDLPHPTIGAFEKLVVRIWM